VWAGDGVCLAQCGDHSVYGQEQNINM